MDRADQTERPVWEGRLSHPFYSKLVKRLMDVAVSVVLLAPCLLVMLPISLMVRLSSPGPILYRAWRGGYHNKPFRILKFRTMVVGADRFSGTTGLNDARVTKVGRVLRRTKLDELPQLINVLKGDMSLIGPRPELLKYTDRYTPEQQCILWVRPGISDPSSLKLIALDEKVGQTDPEGEYERHVLGEKNRMRVEYAQKQSFLTDAGCFVQTIGGVLRKIVRRHG